MSILLSVRRRCIDSDCQGIEKVKQSEHNVLVATTVGAEGQDIGDLDVMINCDDIEIKPRFAR